MGVRLIPSVLVHSSIGRKSQAEKYTAAANYRYIVRLADTIYTERANMPDNYKSAQQFLRRRENSIRKDGRVCDKFVVVFPHGMKTEHATEAVRGFLQRISENRTPWIFSLQSFGEEHTNPHAHVIFIDADVETKQRVFRTSDLGSSERLKDAWEESANSILEREGYDFRIDRNARFLEQSPSLVPDLPPDAPATYLDDAPAHVHVLEPDFAQEADVAKDPHETHMDAISDAVTGETTHIVLPKATTLADRISGISRTSQDLRRVQHAIYRVNSARSDYADARRAADTWEKTAKAYAQTHALKEREAEEEQHRMEDHVTGSGKLRGVHVRLFKWEWKSGTRVNAERQQRRLDDARHEAKKLEAQTAAMEDLHSESYKEAMQYAERMDKTVREMEELYGTKEEMREAEALYQNTVEREIEGLSAAQVFAEYEAGNISVEDAIEVCHQLHDSEYVALLKDLRDRDMGYEP